NRSAATKSRPRASTSSTTNCRRLPQTPPANLQLLTMHHKMASFLRMRKSKPTSAVKTAEPPPARPKSGGRPLLKPAPDPVPPRTRQADQHPHRFRTILSLMIIESRMATEKGEEMKNSNRR